VIAPVQNANQIYLCALDEEGELIFSAHTPARGFIFEPWGDLNLDSTIGADDLLIFLMEWGTICF
jgi:hypothetical protein